MQKSFVYWVKLQLVWWTILLNRNSLNVFNWRVYVISANELLTWSILLSFMKRKFLFTDINMNMNCMVSVYKQWMVWFTVLAWYVYSSQTAPTRRIWDHFSKNLWTLVDNNLYRALEGVHSSNFTLQWKQWH